MTEVLTHLELSKRYAGKRPDWQHEINALFFKQIWNTLEMGGFYLWPGAGLVLRKVEGGWTVEDDGS